MRCACAILSSVVCAALQYFYTLPHKLHDFHQKKKVIAYKIFILIFSTTFVSKHFSFYEELSEI